MTVKLSMICTRQSNDTYFAVCPEVKGCFTQGDSYEEAAANLKELVEFTIREELMEEQLHEIGLAKAKIFSEFEIAI